MTTTNILIILACTLAIYIVGKILSFPIKSILKLLINTIIGAIIIFLINLIGANFGFNIGLNIFTSIFVGFLGIPGAIVLIILKLLL